MFKKLGSAVCCLLFAITAGLISLPAFSITQDELVGTWEWSGAGCRDTNLSESSHVHKPVSTTPSNIDWATFVFNSDGSAELTFSQDDQDQAMNGQFEIIDNGQKVELREADSGAPFSLQSLGEWLVVAECREYAPQTADEDMLQDLQNKVEEICGSNKCFVYMVGKVE